MDLTSRSLFSVLVALLLAGCGSSDDAPKASGSPLLDPTAKFNGRTFSELAAEWVQYEYAYSPPDCQDPLSDVTGAACEANQDPESDVFFLVGTSGGVAKRTECPVPADKPLFFPLVNVWADNAGLPADETLSDAELESLMQGAFDELLPDSAFVEVDGEKLDGANAGSVNAAPYTLSLADAPNSYTCQGQDGVSGDFQGRISGYFALLSPLGKGKHSVHFGGSSRDDGHGAANVDSTYEFTLP